MTVVQDNDMAKAADDAVKPDAAQAPVPAPIEEPAQVPTFSPHISHSQAHYGKAQVEARGYELGIAMLEAELRGITEKADGGITRIEAEVEEEISDISSRARRRVARIREDLVTDAANLNRRLSDLRDTHAMLVAQIDAYRVLHPETKETNHETNTERDTGRTSEAAGDDDQSSEQGAGAGTAG